MHRFQLPKPPRTPLSGYLVSAAIHGAVVLGLLWVSTRSREYGESSLIRLFDEVEEDFREYPMILLAPVEGGVERREVTIPDAVAGVGAAQLAPAPVTRAPGVRGLGRRPQFEEIGVEGAVAGVPGAIVVGTRRRIGPAFGDGRPWRPPPARGVAAEERWTPLETVLAEQIAAMLDSALVDSLAQEGLPSWVFNVGGQSVGIDQQFIHLGPIKIPTVLLGLLPIPATGSFDQARQAEWLADVRQQILRQARMMEDRQMFNDFVKQLRERKEREREAERRRRAVASDSIIPSGRR